MRFVRRARSWLPQDHLGRGVLTLMAATTIAEAMSAASAPIITRLYTPAEVGTYSVAISILAILVTISTLSYQFAIPLPDSAVGAANVLVLCLGATLGVSVASGVVLWLAGPQFFGLLGTPELSQYVVLLLLGQLVGAFLLALSYWAVRVQKFSAIAATNLTQTATTVAAQIGLGVAGVGAFGLFVGYVMGSLLGSVRLARSAWQTDAGAHRGVTRQGVLAAASRYRRFPIFSLPSSIVNTVGQKAPLLFLVALYGTEVGGRYALADRLLGLCVALVSESVGQVFFAEGARVVREQPASLRALFWRTTRSLALAGIGPFAAVAVIAPILAGPVFGKEWSEMGLFVAILAPMYFMIFVTNPTGATLDFLERQDLQFALGIVRAGILSGAVIVATAMHLPPISAVGLLSIAGCLTYGAYGLGSWYAILTHAGQVPGARGQGGASDQSSRE